MAYVGAGRTLRRTVSSGDSTPWSHRTRTPGSVTPRPVQTSTVMALVAGRGQATGEVGLAALVPDCPLLILAQLTDSYTFSRVVAKIQAINPCEILLPATFCEPSQPLYRLLCQQLADVALTALPRHQFQSEAGVDKVAQLCLPSLASGIGALRSMYYCATAAAALFAYMESVKSIVFRPHTLNVQFQAAEAAVIINSDTCRRLELVQSQPGGRPEDTVYGVIRRTLTPGGCRRLRAELLQPSVSHASIRTRQQCIQELVDTPDLLYRLRAVIGRFRDVERIHSFCIQQHDVDTERNVEQRLNNIISLKASLEFVDALRECLEPARHSFFVSMKECLQEALIGSLLLRLRAVIHDDVKPCRGGIEQRVQRCYAIKAGINGMLDVARRLYSEAYDEFVSYVSQLADQLRLSLRPGYNSSRGFHVVATAGRSGRPPALPDHLMEVQHNKSTTTFTTEAIVQMNTRADASVLEIHQLSSLVVCELLNELQPDLRALYQLAEVVSTTDLLVGFADLATSHQLTRPEFGPTLAIKGGWHPLLAACATTPIVPTDFDMGADCRLAIITGSNMSGKSTLLKQVAITQILAQLGSFVPAETAVLPIVDQIFCRSGCEERADRQASSFQEEMRDVSSMLQQATGRSLVLLDELGRGTASEQGDAITWAVCEQLLRRRCRALASTHFQQCCCLAQLYQQARNFHIGLWEVAEEPEAGSGPTRVGEAARRHCVRRGPYCQTGYGVRLAATTSLPATVLQRATHLLQTTLHPPREVVLSAEGRQEREVMSLAATLAELDDGMEPEQLRQTLRQLRSGFVGSQLPSERCAGSDTGTDADVGLAH